MSVTSVTLKKRTSYSPMTWNTIQQYKQKTSGHIAAQKLLKMIATHTNFIHFKTCKPLYPVSKHCLSLY